MERRLVSARTVLLGFLAALVALAIIGAVVGVDDVLAALAAADPVPALAALGATAVWLSLWGLSLYVSLRSLGVAVSPARSVLVYVSASFLNNITPFAQVGGEALSAAVIGRATDAEYETGLAAVTAVDVVNLVPTPLIAVLGLAWLAAGGDGSPVVETAATSLLAVSLVVGVLAVVAWRYRAGFGRRVVRTVVGGVAVANRTTGRVLPVDPPRLARRVESYLRGVVHVFEDRRRLGLCLGLSAAGWAALVGALWLSLLAVGHPVSLALVAVVLPVGMLAIAVPLPGGVGGVEAALVGLLVAGGGVPLAPATAGVLVYRGATYWAPLTVGGIVTAVLSVDDRSEIKVRGE